MTVVTDYQYETNLILRKLYRMSPECQTQGCSIQEVRYFNPFGEWRMTIMHNSEQVVSVSLDRLTTMQQSGRIDAIANDLEHQWALAVMGLHPQEQPMWEYA